MTRHPSSSVRRRPEPPADKRNPELVYEDDDIIVVDKPTGLLTIATEKERHATLYRMLFEYVKEKRPPEMLFIVHRLDRDASGLLVFAKSEEAKRVLQLQFKNHSAGRTYVAVCQGRWDEERMTIRNYLAENAAYRVYSTNDPHRGRLAVTHVRVVRQTQHRSLVEATLETGRKHQIRVHLTDFGHPILGDKAYGDAANPIRRLALHGTRLVFKHPTTHKTLTFDSPMPDSFAGLVQEPPRSPTTHRRFSASRSSPAPK